MGEYGGGKGDVFNLSGCLPTWKFFALKLQLNGIFELQKEKLKSILYNFEEHFLA